jgi:hypothetical protein
MAQDLARIPLSNKSSKQMAKKADLQNQVLRATA